MEVGVRLAGDVGLAGSLVPGQVNDGSQASEKSLSEAALLPAEEVESVERDPDHAGQ